MHIKENKSLREEMEKEVSSVMKSFLLASAVTSPEAMEEAVSMPGFSIDLEIATKNVMSVPVPVISIIPTEKTELYPYSFASVSSELDMSINNLSDILVKLVKLAEIEKTCNMLADEIEKNRRRVNALEYVMIQLQRDNKVHHYEARRK